MYSSLPHKYTKNCTMLRSRSVRIPDNIYLSFSPIWFVSRLVGLFPFSINFNGSALMLKWSALYQIYSIVLLIILVTLATYRMINEIQMGNENFRMKGTTSKYVTCTDTIITEIIIILGIFNTKLCWKNLCAFVNYISEIDTIIYNSTHDLQRARRISIYSLTIIIGTTIFVLGLDLYVQYNTYINDDKFLIITYYVPYQLSFVITVVIKCLYAHMGYGIKMRLKLINDTLQNINFKNKQKQEQKTSSAAIGKEVSNKNKFSKRTQLLLKNLERRGKVSDIVHVIKYEDDKGPSGLSEGDLVLQLTKAYLIICDAVNAINDFFEHIILVTLVASLLHLTVTPYFFIVELTGGSDATVLILQSLWFLTHFLHLVLVVEPCNICLEEANLMNGFVCRLLSSGHAGNCKKQLELLFTQLQYRQIEFSAFGLGTIHRSLVTSMAGAVTVYLVTIIQFRNSAGT